jgi:hypothetical protein
VYSVVTSAWTRLMIGLDTRRERKRGQRARVDVEAAREFEELPEEEDDEEHEDGSPSAESV